MTDPVAKKKIVFLTGTRADFGKLKSLLNQIVPHAEFDVHIFVTGMHMLSKYGSTYIEVERNEFPNIYKFINQNHSDNMDVVLGKTIAGFSDYITEIKPDLIVVHGDRVEAMAGAIVGSLRNIKVAHIEGGEVSGTIDEVIRHSVSKLSHVHFVANQEAKNRLIQLGEHQNSIYVIGSPDLDIMASAALPTLEMVREKYEFSFATYGVVLFHPVTTESDAISWQAEQLISSLKKSQKQYVIIFPNNDYGSQNILDAYEKARGNTNFRILPSMNFEHFLTLLKNAEFLIGNSSAGVRETPFYGVPSIDIGTRQNRRAKSKTIIHTDYTSENIDKAILAIAATPREKETLFGHGNSAEAFTKILSDESFWNIPTQKYFIDVE